MYKSNQRDKSRWGLNLYTEKSEQLVVSPIARVHTGLPALALSGASKIQKTFINR